MKKQILQFTFSTYAVSSVSEVDVGHRHRQVSSNI